MKAKLEFDTDWLYGVASLEEYVQNAEDELWSSGYKVTGKWTYNSTGTGSLEADMEQRTYEEGEGL